MRNVGRISTSAFTDVIGTWNIGIITVDGNRSLFICRHVYWRYLVMLNSITWSNQDYFAFGPMDIWDDLASSSNLNLFICREIFKLHYLQRYLDFLFFIRLNKTNQVQSANSSHISHLDLLVFSYSIWINSNTYAVVSLSSTSLIFAGWSLSCYMTGFMWTMFWALLW